MERRKVEPLGDRGARRQRHDQTDHHQRPERAEEPAIDRAHPVGDGSAFRSRDHWPPLPLQSPVRRRPRRDQARHGRPERVAARLEIGELIEGGAGRRQQHHRLLRRGSRGVPRRRLGRRAQGPASLRRNGAGKRARERLARRADQIGLGDPRKQPAKRLDAALLRLAAENPVDVAKRQQRLLGRVGVGRLRVVDEQHSPEAPDLLHAMREAGKRQERPRDLLAPDAHCPCRGIGERRVLPVVRAAQRPRVGEIDGKHASPRASTRRSAHENRRRAATPRPRPR